MTRSTASANISPIETAHATSTKSRAKSLLRRAALSTLLCAGMMAAPLQATHAAELVKRTFCVFDIIGKSGPIYNAMQEYRLAAMGWGVDLELKPFTDERITVEEFKSGQCDAVGVTGLRGRTFNAFTGTIDSIGAIPDYDTLRVVLQKLASPQLAPLMKSGEYEVVGIGPAGAVYLMVNDRSIKTVSDLSGKRIAVLDFDKSQGVMVESIGASPVTATIATFGSMFNNGAVDVIAAPAVAFGPLELHKGVGSKGAIVDFAMVQLTVQVLTRHDRFPEGFGQKSREYILAQFDKTMAEIGKATQNIDSKMWMKIPEKDIPGYTEMARQTRLRLRDEGFYDPKMLKFLSRVRCELKPGLSECTAPDRE
ncbi:RND type efflux pump involved in aminoglycoside resistance [gamma proteobacterium HdN1]|nr:RND type efflux pump involved in aminoglycoside resistance [gamma proteobacterium HdN1]